MADDETTTLQITVASREKLRVLAKEDFRSSTGEFDWLIEQEWTRRYSRPNPTISVAEAIQANEATSHD